VRRAALPIVVVLLLVAAAPSGAPAARTKAYACGAVGVTVLLWPHGHKAIRSVHFPAKRTPNIQVYRYDPRFAGGNFLLYADAKGNVHPVPDYCGTTTPAASSAIAEPQTLKGKRAVTCTVRSVQAFEVTHTAHGIKVLGRTGAMTLWTATMTGRGAAKITFDSSACQIGPSPPA
jgi:hypothetical protein